jgi:multidrug efflux pump subunit AcrA (membrane-fusion protein)
MASNKPGKTRKVVIAVLLLFGLAGLGIWAALRKREPVITVQTEAVARRNLTELVVATGKIQAVTKVVINPEVSGEIVDLPVREGQSVKKGDLLVRIKPDPYIANRNSADATFRSSLAGVELSRAELEKAKLEFARFEKLFREKLVSESDFLTARTSLDVGQARFESSRHQSDQAKAALARAEEDLTQNHDSRADRRHGRESAIGARRARGGHRDDGWNRDHDSGGTRTRWKRASMSARSTWCRADRTEGAAWKWTRFATGNSTGW